MMIIIICSPSSLLPLPDVSCRQYIQTMKMEKMASSSLRNMTNAMGAERMRMNESSPTESMQLCSVRNIMYMEQSTEATKRNQNAKIINGIPRTNNGNVRAQKVQLMGGNKIKQTIKKLPYHVFCSRIPDHPKCAARFQILKSLDAF